MRHADDGWWLPSLNASRVPDGDTDGEVIADPLEECDQEIAASLGDLASDIVYFGCTGTSRASGAGPAARLCAR